MSDIYFEFVSSSSNDNVNIGFMTTKLLNLAENVKTIRNSAPQQFVQLVKTLRGSDKEKMDLFLKKISQMVECKQGSCKNIDKVFVYYYFFYILYIIFCIVFLPQERKM